MLLLMSESNLTLKTARKPERKESSEYWCSGFSRAAHGQHDQVAMVEISEQGVCFNGFSRAAHVCLIQAEPCRAGLVAPRRAAPEDGKLDGISCSGSCVYSRMQHA